MSFNVILFSETCWPSEHCAFPRNAHATAPNNATVPKTLRAFFQPISSEIGATVVTETATPKVKAAISRPFITVISRGFIHRIRIGAVVGIINPNPIP